MRHISTPLATAQITQNELREWREQHPRGWRCNQFLYLSLISSWIPTLGTRSSDGVKIHGHQGLVYMPTQFLYTRVSDIMCTSEMSTLSYRLNWSSLTGSIWLIIQSWGPFWQISCRQYSFRNLMISMHLLRNSLLPLHRTQYHDHPTHPIKFECCVNQD